MKSVISGLAMLGFLGWTLTGRGGAADADRLVEKPPQLVYGEFARLFPLHSSSSEGAARDGSYRKIEVEVRRTLDSAIDYRFILDGQPVMTMALAFAPEEGGRATRVTGDLEVEQALLRFAAQQSGGEAKHMPGFAVDYAMDAMVDEMADAIEAGQPVTRDMLFPLLNVR